MIKANFKGLLQDFLPLIFKTKKFYRRKNTDKYEKHR